MLLQSPNQTRHWRLLTGVVEAHCVFAPSVETRCHHALRATSPRSFIQSFPGSLLGWRYGNTG